MQRVIHNQQPAILEAIKTPASVLAVHQGRVSNHTTAAPGLHWLIRCWFIFSTLGESWVNIPSAYR